MSEDDTTEIDIEDISEIKPKAKKIPTLMMIVIGVVVLLTIVIGTLLLTPAGKALFGKKEDTHNKQAEVDGISEEKKPSIDPKNITYVNVPEMLINLKAAPNTPTGKVNFLKISVVIELESAHEKESVEALRPRITDQMQVFLRNLDPSDFEGSNGVLRVQQELLTRIKTVVEPTKINNVLIKDLLVQ